MSKPLFTSFLPPMSVRSKILIVLLLLFFTSVIVSLRLILSVNQASTTGIELSNTIEARSGDVTTFSEDVIKKLFSSDWLNELAVQRSDLIQALWQAYGDYSEGTPLPGRLERRISTSQKGFALYLTKYGVETNLEGRSLELFTLISSKWAEVSASLDSLSAELKSGSLPRAEALKRINNIANQMLEIKDALSESTGILKDLVRKAMVAIEERRQIAQTAAIKAKETAAKVGGDAKQSFHFAVGGVILQLLLAILAIFTIIRICKNLNLIVDGLDRDAHRLRTFAQQVSRSAERIAQVAEEQSSAVKATGELLEKLEVQSKTTSQRCVHANEITRNVHQASQTSEVAFEEMSESVNRVKQSSAESKKILQTIDSISFQTNLLALNAAVEAARAGDAGRGFAVVAEEVRSLAQRSSEAAHNTSQKISLSDEHIQGAIDSVSTVRGSLQNIKTAAGNTSQIVDEVAQLSSEQSKAVSSISHSMAELDQSVGLNASAAEESAASGTELLEQATILSDTVTRLQILVNGKEKHRAST